MDQHPVPQNVTTFQFRLIGDMTIKQFGFLAAGGILAFISYKLPLPFFFSWPLTILFAVGGVGFAFVPIEERPMDVWVLAFLKNVYSPTVFTWEQSIPQKKVAPVPVRTPIPPVQRQYVQPTSMPVQQHVPSQTMQYTLPQNTVKTTANVVGTMYASKQPTQTVTYPHKQMHASSTSAGLFDWIFDLFKPRATAQMKPVVPAAQPTQAPHMSTPSVVGSHLDISMPPTVAKRTVDQKPVIEKLQDVVVSTPQPSVSQEKTQPVQKQQSIPQPQRVSPAPQPVVSYQRPNVAQQHIPSAPPQQNQEVVAHQRKQPTVKIITPEGAVKAGLPRLTTFPNVVTGITKDSDNNFLPGVLVTVKDKDGIPVRALKTNRLGQFAASTPLSNGVYFVEIEDPRQRYTFDRVQITLNGSVVPALEIITKSQKQITRDKLAKELFGTT